MDYTEPTVTQEIDGIHYTSTKVSATRALALLARTVRVLGESGLKTLVIANLGAVAGGALKAFAAGAEEQIFGALVRAAHGLEADPELPKDLMQNVKASRLRPAGAGPVAPHFDAHFSGELLHMLRVVGFVLQHNYMGFSLGAGSNPGSHTAAETETAPLSG